MEKTCNQCNEIKDSSSFYTNKDGRLGLTSKCKDCIQKNRREDRALKRSGKYIPRSRLGINKGSNNGYWKGDNVCYTGLHLWIKTRLPKSESCQECGLKTDKLDLANISQEYKRDVSDWEWLCRSCHMKKDGRINNLKQYKDVKFISI